MTGEKDRDEIRKGCSCQGTGRGIHGKKEYVREGHEGKALVQRDMREICGRYVGERDVRGDGCGLDGQRQDSWNEKMTKRGRVEVYILWKRAWECKRRTFDERYMWGKVGNIGEE